MACKTRKIPVRVGFKLTWVKVTCDPGTIAAATRKKAAEDRSPGTWTVCPCK